MSHSQTGQKFPEPLFRTYRNVSIASVGEAFVVFAKASRFHQSRVIWAPATCSPSDPAAWSVIETTYLTIIFLVRSINDLYLRLSSIGSATFNLHRLFLSTLLDLFDAIANNLLKYFTNDLRSLDWVLCAIMLRSPFYAYVLLHMAITI